MGTEPGHASKRARKETPVRGPLLGRKSGVDGGLLDLQFRNQRGSSTIIHFLKMNWFIVLLLSRFLFEHGNSC